MTPEAQKVQDEFLQRGVNLVDRFGVFEAAGEVVRREVLAERERCAALLEARATELEPLEGKSDLVHWKHGFLLGLASRLRQKEEAVTK